VRVFVLWDDQLLGNMDIANHYQPISPTRLRETIVDYFGLRLLDSDRRLSMSFLWAHAIAFLTQRYMPAETAVTAMPKRLPANIPVSVVVATLDRPDDLRNCLRCLIAQESPRSVEIVIVDNNPTSGLTPPVVAEFPDVVLVNEPRKGLAYARNAGFTACKGDIAIATDDDVTLPSGWLETLVAPFVRPEVMVVTGNTLPLKMETTAQELFERYGGLGRGFEPLEVNGDWFESFRHHPVPTWQLGATANAAFRVTIFNHPQIGLMDEALGPGMPSGVGEDTYLFYKVLKANYTLVYEPAAYVWHKHRETMSALRRQIYNYSKGHVSYHLTTLFRDYDARSLWQLMLHLPWFHLRRIVKYFLRRNPYPLSLIMLEIAGNLVGPWTLWRSHLKVRRLGRSRPYVPFNKHVSGGAEEIRISGC
jgi:glycosyltransferase involved in cell wall biosynthesis